MLVLINESIHLNESMKITHEQIFLLHRQEVI